MKTPLDDSYEEEESAEMVIVINKVRNFPILCRKAYFYNCSNLFSESYFQGLNIHNRALKIV